MSIEENLERIADALEKLVNRFENVDGVENPPADEERPKATRKKGASKKKGAAKKEKEEPAEPDGPTREDVQTALVDFVKSGPGKDAAKEILEEFKAGSISTLDEKVYGAFIDRLNEVSGG